MFNKEEVEEWNKIQSRLRGILNRDIKNDLVTKTLMEFIDLYEKQREELEHCQEIIKEWREIEELD